MRFRRLLSAVLSIAMVVLALQTSAQAAVVATDSVVAAAEAHGEALAKRLEARGVDPVAARERVAALTASERAALAQELDRLPAGGDALGAVVFVGLVLLLTDLLGFTDVYPFVTRTVNDPKPSVTGAGCEPAVTASAPPWSRGAQNVQK